MHHATQVPLYVDLGAASVIKACQPFVVADIAKHRLDGADSLAVKLSATG